MYGKNWTPPLRHCNRSYFFMGEDFIAFHVIRSQQKLATAAMNSEREALVDDISGLSEVRKMLRNPHTVCKTSGNAMSLCNKY